LPELLALSTMWGATICGLTAMIAPWFVLRVSRRAAARTAGILVATGTVMFAISNRFMPETYNIRVDLVVNGFLLFVAGLAWAGLTLWAGIQRKDPRGNVTGSVVHRRRAPHETASPHSDFRGKR
jgi:hypothetical protein